MGLRSDTAAMIGGCGREESGDAFQTHLAPPLDGPTVQVGDVTRLTAIAMRILVDEDFEDRAAARRRAVRHGVRMLALLSSLRDAETCHEVVASEVLDRLAASLEKAGPSPDGELGSVLEAIETRVQVELARRGR